MLHAKLEFDVEDKAKILSKALNPDSLEWCKCFDRDGRLFIEIRTEKIGTLLYTVDDYLMNIKVALEILNLI
ncbi:hypothetical protein DRP05_00045 [Archaeoglobales archaeon]|nr:MAG: hypothetical protein DRP05_00045 [Archaeoglobales archaeon]